MKQVSLSVLSILAVVIIIGTNMALAEQNFVRIEMGESGQTVSFPSESKEIASRKVDKVGLVQSNVLHLQKSKFKTFEMGEGGHLVSFLMTPEEIKAEAAAEKLNNDAAELKTTEDSPKVVYELAESGVLIEFPADKKRVYPESLARVEVR